MFPPPRVLSMTRVPVALLLLAGSASAAPPPTAPATLPADHATRLVASEKLFKEKVRPFLVSQCLDCHGGAKEKSGFNLATREHLLKGGDRGPAVTLWKGKDSPLVRFVARTDEPHMPPKKAAPKEAVEFLTQWIDTGAAYDSPLVGTTTPTPGGKKPLTVTAKDKEYWAYRPIAKTPVPEVRNPAWPRNPVDRFLLEKMEKVGIVPAGDADPRVLIRRIHFDLVGLPPPPELVEGYAKNPTPEAFAKIVDDLLESPAYGERWGRHWLDPARYAESHGFEHDYHRPNAYHYRDFVIKALNSDMPYDQFVKWQIAGDELAPGDPLALAATGFLGAGVYPTQITNLEAERIRYDAMDDMLSTTGYAMLALTVACARCHDHKYDPIPTRDYYRMLSAFTTTVRAEVEVDLGSPEQKKAAADFEAKLKPLAEDLKQFEETELPKRLETWLAEQTAKKANPPILKDSQAAAGLKLLVEGKKWDKLPKPQRDALVKWFGPQDSEWRTRRDRVSDLEKSRPPSTKVKIQATTEGQKPMRHHTADGSIPDFYPETYILKRGDVGQKDGVASPGFLQVLSRTDEAKWQVAKPAGATTSFRRAGLANWLTDTETGAGSLAARVIVNRLWHHHFGRGIVSTVNDFGFQGDPPTHPELLEWLANDLVSHGWKLKRVHKLLVTSRAYQLASGERGAGSAERKEKDPENKLWSHRPRRRLEAEAIRDNLLAVAGVLDSKMYGPGTLDQGMRRRSIYFQVQRSQLIPMLQVFDWPDTLTSASARPTTVVAPQALLFLNNPHVRSWANSFAGRLKPTAEKNPAAAVELAYRLAYGRPPSAKERDEGVEFLRSGKLEKSLQDYALVLMSLNEFIYVD